MCIGESTPLRQSPTSYLLTQRSQQSSRPITKLRFAFAK
jgi:hypothetical protein